MGNDGTTATATIDQKAFDAYMKEYEQCAESYRHTYQTIWQAGAVFVTASAAIIAIAASSGGSVDPVAQVVAPIPFLFWWWGVFRPMNAYGELRNDRLVELERKLSASIDGLDMRHFDRYGAARKSDSLPKRIVRLRWITRPRVSEVVNLFGFVLLAVEVALVWVHYLS